MTTARLGPLLLVVPAAWAALNGLQFVFDPTLRYRAESSWFILAGIVLAGTLYKATSVGATQSADISPREHRSGTFGLLFLALAFILYGPTLSIGLLSDDFVLLSRASSGSFIDRTWDYVRPLPLLVWWAVAHSVPAASVATTLHAINVALHGLNAVARVSIG